MKSDNTVDYIIASSNNSIYTDANIVMKYYGTYLEKDNEIILSIISTDNGCEDGKYVCKDIISLTKDNNGNLIEDDIPNGTYSKVSSLILVK